MKYHSHITRHHRRPLLFHPLGLALVLMWLCLTASAQSGGTDNPQLVSFNAAGTAAGNGASSAPQASDDGRYVLFMSNATDLVSTPDNNGTCDIFMRDTQTGTTTLVSVNAAGTAAGNGASSDARMTPDGRYVIFTSAASDLVSGDTNGKSDVFRRDMQTGTTVLVSVSPSGALGGNGDAQFSRITPNGRYVLFTTTATDFAPSDPNGAFSDVYLRDLQTGTTTLVSVNATGTATGNSLSTGLSVTPDGRYVLFYSYASDLGANDTNNAFDLYRRDMQTGTTALASTNSDGTRSGNCGAGYGEMSDNGRFVAFESSSTDLTPDYNNAAGTSVFFHDFTTNTTVLISLPLTSTFGPSVSPHISHDGRYVIFERVDTDRNPVPGADLRHDKVLRWDRQLQQFIQFPTVNDHVCQMYNTCKAQVSNLILSPDARYVAYRQTETKGPGGSPPANPPLISTGLVVLDTLGQGLQLLPDFFGNTAQDSSLFSVAPGNLIQGPKLTFSSANSHAAQDTNSFTDVYLYAPPSHAGIFSLAPDTQDVGEAAGSATFTVSRSDYFGDSAMVDYATSDGTAKAGSDYVATSGTLTFGPGEVTKTFSVPIIDDQIYEGKETFNVTISNPRDGGTLKASSAVVNIIDNDALTLNIEDTFVTEGTSPTNTTTLVKLTLSRASDSPVSVSYSTIDTPYDGDAVAGKDYVPTRGTVTFNAGETTKEIPVSIVADDIHENTEFFYVYLSQPQGATLGQSVAYVAIQDDDTAYLRFSASNYNVGEADGNANVTVMLTNADGRPIKTEALVSCNWAPYPTGTLGTPGVATPFIDYSPSGGMVSFGPGDTSSAKTFTVRIFDDSLVEGNETFAVRIFDPYPSVSTVIPVQLATVTIIDDDRSVQFAAPTFTANEASGVATINVTRAGDASVPFSVSYATSNGTASSRADYIAARGRLDFAAGEMSKTFQVLIVNDAFVEWDETVKLTLSDPTSPVVLGPQSTAQLIIVSDDTARPTANPVDDARFFVMQHYLDFLNRLPDQSGLDFWTGELNRLLMACDSVPAGDARRRCQLGARAQVSTAFFLSIEFQQTGFYVIRLYETSFGRTPTLWEFSGDVQRIANGVVVGAPGWEQQLETNKQRFTDEWVQRPNFSLIYSDQLSNTDYVSRLFYNGAGNDRAEPALLTQLVNSLDHTQTPFETRATALRKVVESYSVTDRQYNPALVLMQYYGYLRRDPDDAPDGNLDGYNFWLNKLNSFSQPGEDMRDPNQALARIKRAQMVDSFIDAGEYRGRFGP